MKNKILSQIGTECPWRDTLYWYNTIDSTNLKAKQLAKEGAPGGTVVVAGMQTGGRGRLGRSFASAEGGMYLSAILRPRCTPDKLMHLTCAAGVAACRAVERVSGIRPDIKWINDLVYGGKKLGGILTELGINSSGSVDYAIVGIGINCRQKGFPEELQKIATSLSKITNAPCSPDQLTAALIEELCSMDAVLLTEKKAIMRAYRDRCITLGKEISLLRGEEISHGKALDIDDDGGLVVEFSDGSVKTVSSGEVSVRGMYGYL